MPNVGKPSTGCYSCRRMKVRCDETKPACNRCTRARRTCPGYASIFLFADPSKRPRKRTSKGAKSEQQLNVPTHDVMPVEQHLSMVRPPETTRSDWYDRSAKLLFHTYTHSLVSTETPFRCFLHLLEGYCSSGVHESYLTEALKAASLSNMAHRVPGNRWIQVQAVAHRVEALKEIRAALEDERKARKDDLLVALWCIEKAELMDAEQDVWQNHTAGISAVLRLRGPAQLSTTEIGRQLFRVMNHQLTTRDVVFGTCYRSSFQAESWSPFSCITDLADLSRDYRRLLTAEFKVSTQTLMTRALAIDSQLEAIAPYLIQPTRKHTMTIGQSTIQICHFEKIVDAFPWVDHYPWRLRALRIAAECSEDPASFTSCISQQILGIASIIPALLGETIADTVDPLHAPGSSSGALLAMYSCNAIINTPELENPALKNWALNYLLYIGKAYGIKQAVNFHDYFLSGTVLSDTARIVASSSGDFPKSTPAFIVGHELPMRAKRTTAKLFCNLTGKEVAAWAPNFAVKM